VTTASPTQPSGGGATNLPAKLLTCILMALFLYFMI